MGFTRSMSMLAVAALFAAGCGSDDPAESTEALEDAASETEGDDEGEPEAAGAEDEEAGTEAVAIDPREIGETVRYTGFEFTVNDLEVVDLDAEAGGDVDNRVQGLELVFNVDVYNLGDSSGMPNVPLSLQWDEQGGNVVDVRGNADLREVPSDASSSGTLHVTIPPQDLEVYDDASARLVLGESGSSPAEVPVGTDAELIDRLPVPQTIDEPLHLGEMRLTVTHAEVRWDYGNGHLPDGAALLELTYDLDNDASHQSCSTRGEGAFALTLPNGDGIVDLGVTERCVSGGDTERGIRTGFEIDTDYAGEYTLRHERGIQGETLEDEVTFTLVEGDGVTSAERDAATDDED